MGRLGRIGEERKAALRARLGLSLLLLGICGASPAVERNARGEVPAGGRARDAYLLTRREHGLSTNLSLDEFLDLRRRFSGEFLWVRRGGKRFLIRDRAVLGQAQAFFEPLRTLEPEREALQSRQRELADEEALLEQEQEEMDLKAEELEDDHGENAAAARRDLKRRQDDLRPRMRRLEARERELDTIERSLDERDDALEKAAEERLWHLIDAALARGLGERLESR
jgi:DNA repair exonuclease SbcCD ATPase subunit